MWDDLKFAPSDISSKRTRMAIVISAIWLAVVLMISIAENTHSSGRGRNSYSRLAVSGAALAFVGIGVLPVLILWGTAWIEELRVPPRSKEQSLDKSQPIIPMDWDRGFRRFALVLTGGALVAAMVATYNASERDYRLKQSAWQSIASDSEFLAQPNAVKERVRLNFFQDMVAPGVAARDIDEARTAFLRETEGIFSASSTQQMPTALKSLQKQHDTKHLIYFLFPGGVWGVYLVIRWIILGFRVQTKPSN